MPTSDFFAPLSGTTQPSASGATKLVDGLSTSRFYVVKALATNPGNVRVGPLLDVEGGGGILLEPGTQPVKLDVQWRNDKLYAQATVNGCSVTYHGTEE